MRSQNGGLHTRAHAIWRFFFFRLMDGRNENARSLMHQEQARDGLRGLVVGDDCGRTASACQQEPYKGSCCTYGSDAQADALLMLITIALQSNIQPPKSFQCTTTSRQMTCGCRRTT
jgi:hypothetical protein